MITDYNTLGFLCGMGMLVLETELRRNKPRLTLDKTLIFCGIIALSMILLNQSHGIEFFLCFGLYLTTVTIGLLLAEAGEVRGIVCAFLVNPCPPLFVIIGEIRSTLVLCLIFIVLFLGDDFARRKSKKPLFPRGVFLPYAGFSLSLLAMQYALKYLKQSAVMMMAAEGKAPMQLILALGGMLVFTVLMAAAFLRGDADFPEEEPADYSIADGRECRLAGKDILISLLLLAVTAGMLFYKSGTSVVPQTGITLSEEAGTQQLVFDFGDGADLSSVYLRMGYQPGHFKITLYNKYQAGVLNPEYNAARAFAWSSFDVNQNVQALTIEALDPNPVLNEVVLLAKNGQVIVPENKNEYEDLFDEQNLFNDTQTYYGTSTFDETFYVPTAYKYLRAYDLDRHEDYDHPPLARILIELGIRLFGLNPFGWRFMSAVFGCLYPPLIYNFMLHISRRRKAALAAAVLMMTEFMFFTISRMGMLEVFANFFILLMFFEMYRFTEALDLGLSRRRRYWHLLLCGIATGLAVASKWTGTYAAVGIALQFLCAMLRHKEDYASKRELLRLGAFCVFCFILIPAVFYTLSYLPLTRIYPEKSLIQCMWDNTAYMFSFHTTVGKEHEYGSAWYQWLFDWRPILGHRADYGEHVNTVFIFANPLIAVGGFLAFFYDFYLWVCRKDDRAGFLCIAYLSMLLPWCFISRYSFIYYYMPNLALLTLVLTHAIDRREHQRRWLLPAVVGMSVVLFLLFLPVISGLTAPTDYIRQVLMWFPTWGFL